MYLTTQNAAFVFLTIIVLFVVIVLFLMTLDGLKSVNKFKKGIDIDISGEFKNERD